MLPTMSAHLAVERLEARGLVGTARSSPQPPSAVARRARLEVVVPTRQHWTKRLMSSVCVLIATLFHCRIHRSLRGPSVWPQHRVRSSAPPCPERSPPICGCRRDDAVASARPGRDSSRRGQRRIWFFRMLIIIPQLVRTGTPSCDATWCGAPRRACARQRRATFVPQSVPTKRGPK
jgi:hypothetical protein